MNIIKTLLLITALLIPCTVSAENVVILGDSVSLPSAGSPVPWPELSFGPEVNNLSQPGADVQWWFDTGTPLFQTELEAADRAAGIDPFSQGCFRVDDFSTSLKGGQYTESGIRDRLAECAFGV